MKKQIEELIEKISEELQVHPAIVKAIIMTESAGHIETETNHARGLMQISKIALEDLKKRHGLVLTYNDMFDPEKNIYAGTQYLKDLLNYFSWHYDPCVAIPLSTMSYNWGIGNVLKWIKEEKDNSKIDEVIPNETKSHWFDFLYWYVNFKFPRR